MLRTWCHFVVALFTSTQPFQCHWLSICLWIPCSLPWPDSVCCPLEMSHFSGFISLLLFYLFFDLNILNRLHLLFPNPLTCFTFCFHFILPHNFTLSIQQLTFSELQELSLPNFDNIPLKHRPWELLRSLLSTHDTKSTNYRYSLLVIDTLLLIRPQFCPPSWLDAWIQVCVVFLPRALLVHFYPPPFICVIYILILLY